MAETAVRVETVVKAAPVATAVEVETAVTATTSRSNTPNAMVPATSLRTRMAELADLVVPAAQEDPQATAVRAAMEAQAGVQQVVRIRAGAVQPVNQVPAAEAGVAATPAIAGMPATAARPRLSTLGCAKVAAVVVPNWACRVVAMVHVATRTLIGAMAIRASVRTVRGSSWMDCAHRHQ